MKYLENLNKIRSLVVKMRLRVDDKRYAYGCDFYMPEDEEDIKNILKNLDEDEVAENEVDADHKTVALVNMKEEKDKEKKNKEEEKERTVPVGTYKMTKEEDDKKEDKEEKQEEKEEDEDGDKLLSDIEKAEEKMNEGGFSEQELSKKTVDELKDLLREEDKKVSGNKDELIDRLLE